MNFTCKKHRYTCTHVLVTPFIQVLLIQGCLVSLTWIACELKEFVNKRDLVNYCNIAHIGLHYSSTAETPTGGGDPTTAVVIAVILVTILVAVGIAIILGVAHCLKKGVQGDYYTGPSEHVREVYLCILCTVFVL